MASITFRLIPAKYKKYWETFLDGWSHDKTLYYIKCISFKNSSKKKYWKFIGVANTYNTAEFDGNTYSYKYYDYKANKKTSFIYDDNDKIYAATDETKGSDIYYIENNKLIATVSSSSSSSSTTTGLKYETAVTISQVKKGGWYKKV